MGTTITKAEFDALPDALKAKFEAKGEGYTLIEEDVEGLKKSKAEILQEKKELQAKLAEFEKFKAEIEAKKSEEEEAKQREAGQFAELEKKLRDKIKEVEEAAQAKEQQFLSNLKSERLKNLLAEKGVRPEMTKYALMDADGQFELVADENGFNLKLKDGIGDAKEIDGFVAKLRESTPDFFKPNASPGSGASGSGTNGGNGKTMPRSAFDSMSPSDQMAFAKQGGTLTD